MEGGHGAANSLTPPRHQRPRPPAQTSVRVHAVYWLVGWGPPLTWGSGRRFRLDHEPKSWA
eukprot:162008-Chlamydomonas_euryale.AAC.5